MDFSDFLQLLKRPENELTTSQLEELEALIKEFPYFQPARALYLKALQHNDKSAYNEALKITAAHTTDREVLFDFISSDDFIQNSIADSLNKQFAPYKEEIIISEEEKEYDVEVISTDKIEIEPEDVEIQENYDEEIEEQVEFQENTNAFQSEDESSIIDNLEAITESDNLPTNLEEHDDDVGFANLPTDYETDGDEIEQGADEIENDLPQEFIAEQVEEEITIDHSETKEIEDEVIVRDQEEETEHIKKTENEEEDYANSYQEEFMNSFHYDSGDKIEIQDDEPDPYEANTSNIDDNIVIEPIFELYQTEKIDIEQEDINESSSELSEKDTESEMHSDIKGELDRFSAVSESEAISNSVNTDYDVETSNTKEMDRDEAHEEIELNEIEDQVAESNFFHEKATPEFGSAAITPSLDKDKKRSFLDWLKVTQEQPEEHLKEQSFESPEKEKKFELLEKFIQNNPKIIPDSDSKYNVDIEDASKIDRNELMTETLANLYFEQKKYKKAIKAFKTLSLKFPEKSSFFAARIEEAKVLWKEKEE